jgi:hypothetical protein
MMEPSVIGFVTLLLGLTSGRWPVQVMVAPPAVAAQIRLDGAVVAGLAGEPWSASVDFGRELVPHELTAVALDAEGRVIGQVTQWVNMPQPETQVSVVLARDAEGRVRAAHVGWASKQGLQPSRIEAELDGTVLAPGTPEEIPLPGVDMSRAHVLRVSVLFEGVGPATREVVFGGGAGNEASAELTAVPALAQNDKGSVSVEQLKDRLLLAGKPAPLVAVEQGPFTVAVVAEEGALAALHALGASWLVGQNSRCETKYLFRDRGQLNSSRCPYQVVLQGKDRLILVDPRPTAAQSPSRGMTEVFPTRVFAIFNRVALPGFLAYVTPNPSSAEPPRLADAVAVAGVLAAGGQGRRAVLLAVQSEVAPAELRRACTLLSALGVPLHVWSMSAKPPTEPTGECGVWWDVNISPSGAPTRLRKANESLQKELSRQVLLWIDGTHRPQDVTLAPGGPLVGLVR